MTINGNKMLCDCVTSANAKTLILMAFDVIPVQNEILVKERHASAKCMCYCVR